MEKGKIIVKKTKSGFAGELSFLRKDGRESIQSISFVKFIDDKLNGTECTFEREGGQVVKLIAHDGTLLYQKKEIFATPVQINKQGQRAEIKQVYQDIFIAHQTCLPKDTRLSGIHTIDNFSLKLNKGAFWDDNPDLSKRKFLFCKQQRGKGFIAQITAEYGEIAKEFKSIADRQINYAKAVCAETPSTFTMRPDWRLIVGLGNESVYETSITLHHVYGFPYIPASSIKGVVRSWIITELFESNEGKAISDEGFCRMFGCPESITREEDEEGTKKKKNVEYKSASLIDREKNEVIKEKGKAYAGDLVFFDAFPLTPPQVEPDIMNPHYSKYYSESAEKAKTAPVDYDNPIPVNFLTVKNTAFRFVIGLRRGKNNNLITLIQVVTQ